MSDISECECDCGCPDDICDCEDCECEHTDLDQKALNREYIYSMYEEGEDI